ncbi:MAG TPA: hypothetical protein VGC09_05115 [Rhodopila sp.]
MPNWILLVVLVGHISSSGDEPMTSSSLPMATHEACEAAAADLKAHLVGTAFVGGNVADVITRCQSTGAGH